LLDHGSGGGLSRTMVSNSPLKKQASVQRIA
jgi:hypothetical protein